MDTNYGKQAKEGDYVLVCDFNYVGRSVQILPAIVYKGKARTGVKTTGPNSRFINKITAIVVIDKDCLDDNTITMLNDHIKSLT